MLGLVQQLSGLLLLLYSKYSQRNRVVETTIICGIYSIGICMMHGASRITIMKRSLPCRFGVQYDEGVPNSVHMCTRTGYNTITKIIT